jgi:hypothetical protein
MLALRLIHLIETHSERLSARLLKTFDSERCSDLRKVPADELHFRTQEIFHNLSDWLVAKPEKDLERRYLDLGARRAAQGVRFSHFLWALGATREQLNEFLRAEVYTDNTVELVGMLDLEARLDAFFDRAMYFAARGYERAAERAREGERKPGTLDIVASF